MTLTDRERLVSHIQFRVLGSPATKGSMRAVPRPGGHGIAMIPQNSEKLRTWRSLVALVAQQHAPAGGPWTGPVALDLYFTLPRPKSHYGKKGLKPSAPTYPIGRVGDLDKLVRAVKDALTGVLYADDSQVCDLNTRKRYAMEAGVTGVIVTASEIESKAADAARRVG